MERVSYFELTLTDYVATHHPDKIEDKAFIAERSRMAEKEFERCSHEGMTVEEAKHEANAVLYRNLIFSPFDMVQEIIEKEFPAISLKERGEFIMQMLENNYELLESFNITNDYFEGSEEYMQLYTAMVGNIQLYLEQNGLQ